jgi:hypothetical protein
MCRFGPRHGSCDALFQSEVSGIYEYEEALVFLV